MSEAPQSMKRQLLMDFLGNFDDWIYTGWMISNADGATDGDTEVWESEWKNPIYPRASFDKQALPETRNRCPCTTPIMWNCLIRNVHTGRLEFVGSTCMQHFNMNKRRCKQCLCVNRCKTAHCKDCRRKCHIHDQYHDDNAVHEQPRPEKKIRFRGIVCKPSDVLVGYAALAGAALLESDLDESVRIVKKEIEAIRPTSMRIEYEFDEY